MQEGLREYYAQTKKSQHDSFLPSPYLQALQLLPNSIAMADSPTRT